MAIFSHSKLSTFEQCKLRYKFRYIDKIKPEIEKSIEAHLGSCVHRTLEWLYLRIKEKRVPSMDELIVFYSNNWEATFDPKMPIVKKDLTHVDYFNKGVEFLINYYTNHKPFDENTIEIEKKIWINLDELGEHKILGFVDRIVHNLEKDEYEVHDYKTSGSLPTQGKIDDDRQLGLYTIAIKEMYGKDKEVTLTWHYLSFNKKIQTRRTDEQLSQLKEKTIKLIKKIEETTKFPAHKSILCDWCEYKSICPAWNDVPKKFGWEKQRQLDEFSALKEEEFSE